MDWEIENLYGVSVSAAVKQWIATFVNSIFLSLRLCSLLSQQESQKKWKSENSSEKVKIQELAILAGSAASRGGVLKRIEKGDTLIFIMKNMKKFSLFHFFHFFTFYLCPKFDIVLEIVIFEQLEKSEKVKKSENVKSE